jgi:hypothetical protein
MGLFPLKKGALRPLRASTGAPVTHGFQPFSKNAKKDVDGMRSAAIMPRSLRTRCASVDPQRLIAGARGLSISPLSPV